MRSIPTSPCSMLRLRERDRGLPVLHRLILTSYGTRALHAMAMAGAVGYVLKRIVTSDLVDAGPRVAAGEPARPRGSRPGCSIGTAVALPDDLSPGSRRASDTPSSCWPRGSPTGRSPTSREDHQELRDVDPSKLEMTHRTEAPPRYHAPPAPRTTDASGCRRGAGGRGRLEGQVEVRAAEGRPAGRSPTPCSGQGQLHLRGRRPATWSRRGRPGVEGRSRRLEGDLPGPCQDTRSPRSRNLQLGQTLVALQGHRLGDVTVRLGTDASSSESACDRMRFGHQPGAGIHGHALGDEVQQGRRVDHVAGHRRAYDVGPAEVGPRGRRRRGPPARQLACSVSFPGTFLPAQNVAPAQAQACRQLGGICLGSRDDSRPERRHLPQGWGLPANWAGIRLGFQHRFPPRTRRLSRCAPPGSAPGSRRRSTRLDGVCRPGSGSRSRGPPDGCAFAPRNPIRIPPGDGSRPDGEHGGSWRAAVLGWVGRVRPTTPPDAGGVRRLTCLRRSGRTAASYRVAEKARTKDDKKQVATTRCPKRTPAAPRRERRSSARRGPRRRRSASTARPTRALRPLTPSTSGNAQPSVVVQSERPCESFQLTQMGRRRRRGRVQARAAASVRRPTEAMAGWSSDPARKRHGEHQGPGPGGLVLAVAFLAGSDDHPAIASVDDGRSPPPWPEPRPALAPSICVSWNDSHRPFR